MIEPFKQNTLGHQFFYIFSDPWNFSGSFENGRFERSAAVIEEIFGRLDIIFELGCGEGHFSAHLMGISDRVVGCDVSARALGRARLRVPNGDFRRIDLNSRFPSILPNKGNRLILAAEILYYLKDPERLIEEIVNSGAHIVVTLFHDEVGQMEPILQRYRFSGPRIIESLNPKRPDRTWSFYWLKKS